MKFKTIKQSLATLLSASILSTSLLMITPAHAAAIDYPTIDLGTSANFVSLSGGATFAIGAGAIFRGDPGFNNVGISSSTTPDGGANAYAVANQSNTFFGTPNVTTAFNDREKAMVQLNNFGPTQYIDPSLTGKIITPGAYEPGSNGAPSFAGWSVVADFTFDAQGNPDAIFVMKTKSTLIIGAAVTMRFANGATPSNVYWLVDGAMTLGGASQISGRYFIQTAATIGGASTITGQLLLPSFGVSTLGATTTYIGIAWVLKKTVFIDQTLADPRIGASYNDFVEATSSAGILFNKLTDIQYTATPLPEGLTINATTGLISGFPIRAGLTTTVITAKLRSHFIGTFTRVFALKESTFFVDDALLGVGVVNEFYSDNLSLRTSDSVLQTTLNSDFSVTAGTIPIGLTFNKITGLLSGTPTQFGKYTFTVTGTITDRDSVSKSFTIDVAAPNYFAIFSTVSIPTAVVGVNYNSKVTITSNSIIPLVNPLLDINYSVTAGTLPTGINLNPVTGALTGVPSVVGLASFTITGKITAHTPANLISTILVIANADEVAALAAANAKTTLDAANALLAAALATNAANTAASLIAAANAKTALDLANAQLLAATATNEANLAAAVSAAAAAKVALDSANAALVQAGTDTLAAATLAAASAQSALDAANTALAAAQAANTANTATALLAALTAKTQLDAANAALLASQTTAINTAAAAAEAAVLAQNALDAANAALVTSNSISLANAAVAQTAAKASLDAANAALLKAQTDATTAALAAAALAKSTLDAANTANAASLLTAQITLDAANTATALAVVTAKATLDAANTTNATAAAKAAADAAALAVVTAEATAAAALKSKQDLDAAAALLSAANSTGTADALTAAAAAQAALDAANTKAALDAAAATKAASDLATVNATAAALAAAAAQATLDAANAANTAAAAVLATRTLAATALAAEDAKTALDAANAALTAAGGSATAESLAAAVAARTALDAANATMADNAALAATATNTAKAEADRVLTAAILAADTAAAIAAQIAIDAKSEALITAKATLDAANKTAADLAASIATATSTATRNALIASQSAVDAANAANAAQIKATADLTAANTAAAKALADSKEAALIAAQTAKSAADSALAAAAATAAAQAAQIARDALSSALASTGSGALTVSQAAALDAVNKALAAAQAAAVVAVNIAAAAGAIADRAITAATLAARNAQATLDAVIAANASLLRANATLVNANATLVASATYSALLDSKKPVVVSTKFTISGTQLPTGLVMDSNTGIVSGKPLIEGTYLWLVVSSAGLSFQGKYEGKVISVVLGPKSWSTSKLIFKYSSRNVLGATSKVKVQVGAKFTVAIPAYALSKTALKKAITDAKGLAKKYKGTYAGTVKTKNLSGKPVILVHF